MRIVVAEKPSVARDLARVLGARTRGQGYLEGNGLRITWCVGHMAELEDPAHYDGRWKRWTFEHLPMIPESFELRIRKGVRDQFHVLQRLLREKSAVDVVNACDAGREGELIFRYLYEVTKCKKPVLRLWVSSMTDEAITHAWKRLTPGERYDSLGDAARCRSEADWIIGLNATRAMTCLARTNGGQQLLSVGRVQTPTLAMIVVRDREIESFVPQTFWQVLATFAVEEQPVRWVGTWFSDGQKKEQAERLERRELAEAIFAAIQGKSGVVETSDRRTKREKPPLLYDLTSLQRRANQRYGLSAQSTLAVAQALYEKHKLITYPRTDARFITDDQVAGLPSIVGGLQPLTVYAPFAEAILQLPIKPGKRVVNAKEVGDHHAILPTGRTPNPGRLSPDEKRVFDLVARRFLAALSQDALFDVATLIVAVAAEELPPELQSPLRFRARGRVCREPGWTVVDPPKKGKEVDLPAVSGGVLAQVVGQEIKEGQTRPPRRHNDASLLLGMETAGRQLDDVELKRAMRSAGLGTPATRAAILQTLLNRGYMERRKKELWSTARGQALIDAVPVEDLKSPLMTGRWEARLAQMAEGQFERETFMAAVGRHAGEVTAAIAQADPPPPEKREMGDEPILGTCPVCKTPVREGRGAFSCEKGRDCTFVIFKKVARRQVSPTMVRQLLKTGRTKTLKGFRSKANKPFEAALTLDENGKVKFAFENDRPARAVEPVTVVGVMCPVCGEGKMIRGRAAWGCDRWRGGCRFTIPFMVEKRRVSEADAVALIRHGQVDGLRLVEGGIVPVEH
ncbi:MAG: DNA topoisomerase 3 [Proteobacteria bacterium]|jgi:DNA topoisomerase III|nr:DNA topoisomerase 3 [Pseudomonadota bacterium]